MPRKFQPEADEKKQPPLWQTADEILFIDGIGQEKGHKPTNRPPSCIHLFHLTRPEMLKNYLEYAAKRKIWGVVSKKEVIAHAKDALREGRHETLL